MREVGDARRSMDISLCWTRADDLDDGTVVRGFNLNGPRLVDIPDSIANMAAKTDFVVETYINVQLLPILKAFTSNSDSEPKAQITELLDAVHEEYELVKLDELNDLQRTLRNEMVANSWVLRILQDPTPGTVADCPCLALCHDMLSESKCPQRWIPFRDAIESSVYPVFKALALSYENSRKFYMACGPEYTRIIQGLAAERVQGAEIESGLKFLEKHTGKWRDGQDGAQNLLNAMYVAMNKMTTRFKSDADKPDMAADVTASATTLDGYFLRFLKLCSGPTFERASVCRKLLSSSIDASSRTTKETSLTTKAKAFVEDQSADNIAAIESALKDAVGLVFQQQPLVAPLELLVAKCAEVAHRSIPTLCDGDPSEVMSSLKGALKQISIARDVYRVIDAPSSKTKVELIRLHLYEALLLVSLRHRELVGLGADVNSQVSDPDGLSTRSDLSAALDEFKKERWTEHVKDSRALIEEHPQDRDYITVFTNVTRKEVEVAQAALDGFDVAFMDGPIKELDKSADALEVVCEGMLGGGSWRKDLPWQEDLPFEQVTEVADATLHKQRGIVQVIRKSRGAVIKAKARVVQCRGELGIAESVAERDVIRKANGISDKAEATITEGTTIHNAYRDKRSSLQTRQTAVETEWTQVKDRKNISDLIHPSIRKKIVDFIING